MQRFKIHQPVLQTSVIDEQGLRYKKAKKWSRSERERERERQRERERERERV